MEELKVKDTEITVRELEEVGGRATKFLHSIDDELKHRIQVFLRNNVVASVDKLDTPRDDVDTEVKDVKIVEHVDIPINTAYSDEFKLELNAIHVRKSGGVVFHGGEPGVEGFSPSTYFISPWFELKLSNSVFEITATNAQTFFEIHASGSYNCRFDVQDYVNSLVSDIYTTLYHINNLHKDLHN